jgi:hypothetical protein
MTRDSGMMVLAILLAVAVVVFAGAIIVMVSRDVFDMFRDRRKRRRRRERGAMRGDRY